MLPKKVRIGCFSYDLKIHEQAVNQGTHGDTCLEKKLINIFNNGNSEVSRETLLHEILHPAFEDIVKALFPELKQEEADEREEQIIRLLSPRLMQIFRDNKKITKFLFED